MTLQPIPGAGPDPGDQPQRSVLAWRRTSIALVGVGLVLARVAVVSEHPRALAVTGLALLCGIATFFSSQRRLGDARAALASPPSAFAPLVLATVTTGAMALAVLMITLASV